MGAFLDLYNALRAFVEVNVAQAHPIPLAYDNGPGLGEEGSPHATPDPSSDVWGEVFIEPGESEVAESGLPNENTIRTPGRVRIRVYGPLQGGDADQLAAVDTAYEALLGADEPLFSMSAPSVTVVGRLGAWHAVDVLAPFYSDQFA